MPGGWGVGGMLDLSRWLLGSLALRDAGAGLPLGPPGPATFHEARTNRPCVHLFLPHSCRRRVYGGVWGLVKGDLCIKRLLFRLEEAEHGRSAHPSSFPPREADPQLPIDYDSSQVTDFLLFFPEFVRV